MVVFNALEEFLRELETDKEIIERQIVRLTNLYQQSTMTPAIRSLFVVASYKVRGEVVQLKYYAGDLWNLDQDKKTLEKSNRLQTHIEEACKGYGLEVRGGLHKEGE
jgi:hypothetical protein